MSRETYKTKFTKTSSKGQIVIPSSIRKKLNISDGSILAVTFKDDLIILKKVSSKISPADMKTIKLIEEAWKDIDNGNYKTRTKDDFLRELEEW